MLNAVGGWLKEQLGSGLHPDQLKQNGEFNGHRGDQRSWLRIHGCYDEKPRLCAWVLKHGVVARIVTGPHEANRQDTHLPMRYDTGRPRAVIRFRISPPRTTSLPCPGVVGRCCMNRS